MNYAVHKRTTWLLQSRDLNPIGVNRSSSSLPQPQPLPQQLSQFRLQDRSFIHCANILKKQTCVKWLRRKLRRSPQRSKFWYPDKRVLWLYRIFPYSFLDELTMNSHDSFPSTTHLVLVASTSFPKIHDAPPASIPAQYLSATFVFANFDTSSDGKWHMWNTASLVS